MQESPHPDFVHEVDRFAHFIGLALKDPRMVGRRDPAKPYAVTSDWSGQIALFL